MTVLGWPADSHERDEFRHARVRRLITEAHALVDDAIERQEREQRRVAAVVVLFSGGSDSTTLTHLFRDRATHVAHANTGIGIEATRQFVRETSAGWGVPLLERHPQPGGTYRDLVLGQCRARTGPTTGRVVWSGGFPGPAAHGVMYQRLKQRALEQVRRELVGNPYRERVLFLAGRRAAESPRRGRLAAIPPVERTGSIVWVSPLVHWTRWDINTYAALHADLPRNPVSGLLHMSGECLCGSFARPGELDEISAWFPDTAADIRALEREVAATGVAPPERCRWGWGAGRETPSPAGPLCSGCQPASDTTDTGDAA